MKRSDLLNQVFGNLTVLDWHKGQWYCSCSCGKFTHARTGHLKNGNRISCGCLKVKKAKGISGFNDLLARYKYRAEKVLEVPFRLTRDKFKALTEGSCSYCGQLPKSVRKLKRGNGAYVYNGLDRVINYMGYVDGNVVTCCEICNKAKRDLTHEEFRAWIQRIVQFNS